MKTIYRIVVSFIPTMACAFIGFGTFYILKGFRTDRYVTGSYLPIVVYGGVLIAAVANDFRKKSDLISLEGRVFHKLIIFVAYMASFITASLFIDDLMFRIVNLGIVALANFWFVYTFRKAIAGKSTRLADQTAAIKERR